MVCYRFLSGLESAGAMTGRHRWSPLTAYVLAISAAGFLLPAALVLGGTVRSPLDAQPAFWLLLVFLVASQARPIALPRRGDLKKITISTTFALALLLAWGTVPAALALAAGSAVADLLERKALRKVIFNAAQYILALCAAGGIFALLGGRLPFTIDQLPAFAVGALAFFLVNRVLVEAVVALVQGVRITRLTLTGTRVELLPEAILAAMAPIVVVLAQQSDDRRHGRQDRLGEQLDPRARQGQPGDPNALHERDDGFHQDPVDEEEGQRADGEGRKLVDREREPAPEQGEDPTGRAERED